MSLHATSSRRRRLVLAAACLLHAGFALAPAAVAQRAGGDGSGERVYELELIVFRALSPEHLDERQWIEAAQALEEQAAAAAAGDTPADAPRAGAAPGDAGGGAGPGGPGQLPAPRATQDVNPGDRAPSAPGESPGDASPAALSPGALPLAPAMRYTWSRPPPELFTPLIEETFELTDVARRLARSSAYAPLLHVRWRQYTFPRSRAEPRSVSAARDDYALGGDVRLAVERRLHLALDLVLTTPEGMAYRLTQSRVMTSGETHYIDHPAFGVIARVMPGEYPPGFPEAQRREIAEDASFLPAPPTLGRERPDPDAPATGRGQIGATPR